MSLSGALGAPVICILATRGRIASLGEEKPELKGVKVFWGIFFFQWK
jgi:hypothetical protein